MYITYFKEKTYIKFCDILLNERVKEIKDIYAGNNTIWEEKVYYDQVSITLLIEHNFKNLYIIAAKSAVNTLEYLKSNHYIMQTDEWNYIIQQIMLGSDEIFKSVTEIGFDGLEKSVRIFLMISNSLY